MGFNIAEVSGNSTPTQGNNNWVFTLDLNTPATTVSGDFDEIPVFGAPTEPAGGYSFSALSDTTYGTLTSANTTDGTFTFTVDEGAVFASGTNQTVTFTVTGFDGGSSESDIVTINILICLARGTRVRTPGGPRRVEDLRIGDLIDTLDGPAQPLRWIGSRALDAEDLQERPDMYPILIRKGAFGPSSPHQDLWVSPQHRICVDDWRVQLMFGEGQALIPAKALVNETSVVVDDSVDSVEYFHLLFDGHQVIVTEGLATESFHPGAYVLDDLQRHVLAELEFLFPDLVQSGRFGPSARPSLKTWEGQLVTQGTRLAS